MFVNAPEKSKYNTIWDGHESVHPSIERTEIMCIIVYSPLGERIKDEILMNCWNNHDDGAGMIIRDDNNGIHYIKGLMDIEMVREYYDNIMSDNPECEHAVHFRTGTSGKDAVGCTHPFPISEKEDDLMRLYGNDVDQVMMHNGILGHGEGNLSDTQVYVRDILYPLRKELDNPALHKLIECNIDWSKILIMTKEDTHLLGDWILDGDFYYTNRDYKPRHRFPIVQRDGEFYYTNNELSQKRSLSIVKNGIKSDENLWECECMINFIHPLSQVFCEKCQTWQEDSYLWGDDAWKRDF